MLPILQHSEHRPSMPAGKQLGCYTTPAVVATVVLNERALDR